MEAISLYELNGRIKSVLKRNFTDALWITAEITEMQVNGSGHCYLQLADKREQGDAVVATARGTIWAFVFRTLRPYFETMTGRSLSKGMKVMLLVEVVFHELYGYSLNVRDIDPTYTVGDLERRRREILLQLEEEGIIRMNRELEFPFLPKNIAVISSPTAAGWGDFRNQLDNNPYGYRFHVKLFPAVMQGEKTAESVIAALDRIYAAGELFDVVVVIRGGGSQTDLGSFDSYELAANIAQFPLPVIAGIGHERDETLVDRVAHLRVKTPTAAAACLIETFCARENRLAELQAGFAGGVRELLQEQKARQLLALSDLKRLAGVAVQAHATRLQLLSQRLAHLSGAVLQRRAADFERWEMRIGQGLKGGMERQRHRIELLGNALRGRAERLLAERKRRLEVAETAMRYADPKKVLARGYSITRLNGKAVRAAAFLKAGDLIETEMAQGCVKSEVKERIGYDENGRN